MNIDEFITAYLPADQSVTLGLVSIDIIEHSKLGGNDYEIAKTKNALKSFVELQLPSTLSAPLSWRGDGGEFLFDILKGCDEMVMFADRIRNLISMFNQARGILNYLPNREGIAIRIVCHAGAILNTDQTANLHGAAINAVSKYSKDVQRPGYVVISSEVFHRLSHPFQDRCRYFKENQDLGRTYVLDHDIAICSIQQNNNRSVELSEWIKSAIARHQYKDLLYFAYTNELLYEFLAYQVSGVDVKILVRNWLVEREEEQRYNQALQPTTQHLTGPRPWYKSDLIRARAAELYEAAHLQAPEKSIEMRFYDTPPLFNGAILVSEEGKSCAQIGFSKWENPPTTGGSPYKLDEWAAIQLDERDANQAHLLEYIQSRFWENWSRAKTYEQICESDESPDVDQVWASDGIPYLIIAPQRPIKERKFPVVAIEDDTAVRTLEAFLQKTQKVTTRFLPFELHDDPADSEFPQTAIQEIEKWPGHVVYVCAKSLPPSLLTYLGEHGFPYEIHRSGQERSFLLHRATGWKLFSPTDGDPFEPKDYSLVAKFRRPGNDCWAYIVAGVRAIGTLGAALYLINPQNIKTLTDLVHNEQFAAVAETTFDLKTYVMNISPPKLLIAPKIF